MKGRRGSNLRLKFCLGLIRIREFETPWRFAIRGTEASILYIVYASALSRHNPPAARYCGKR